ncbi:MAG: hypothetical protein IPI77_18320 [Saprospiraceae bacterium]|nr:hypothetical protein [Saprospiraceae bacterium]
MELFFKFHFRFNKPFFDNILMIRCLLIVFFIIFTNGSSFAQGSNNCSKENGGSQSGNFGQGGENNNNRKDYNFLEWFISVVRGGDPNELDGPVGYEVKKWVSINERLGYTIHFENDPKIATAPAQNVFVRMPIDPKININSLQLGDIGFGRFRFSIPPGSSYYADRLDVKDSLGLFVDIIAGIDIENKEIFWRFRSIDPATGLPPTEAQSGFLPVNDTSKSVADSIPGKGEGFVNFSLKPLGNVSTGDTATEKAVIVLILKRLLKPISGQIQSMQLLRSAKLTLPLCLRILLHCNGPPRTITMDQV